ncbi:MAG: DUF2974 domain-containing protein [Clostridium sp.]|nr:DUF2974 domain-containing protein [Clostridium sp.]
MGEKLTEKALLLLCNLIYRKEFSNEHKGKLPNNKNVTVRNILNYIEKQNHKNTQETMTPEEWTAIYEMAKSDPQILNLKVTNQYCESETGAKMVCFADGDGQAYAVFVGTGANEWRDNCVAGIMTDSPQQEKALEWLEQLPYNDIIVTGHSKGGNKAMYVAVTSNKVRECYAYDGEGFSLEFCNKYSVEILSKREKIHLTANYRDFVNILLINIAGDTKYIKNDVGVAGANEYHAPNALFKYDKYGNIKYELGETGNQDISMQMFHEFTVYFLQKATEAEKIVVLSVLGELLTDLVGGENAVVREDIKDMFGVEGIEIALRYFTKYLQEIKKESPLKYTSYREYFEEYIRDGYDTWLYKLVAMYSRIQGNKIDKLFDNLFDSVEKGRLVKAYKAYEWFRGGNVIGRDFSAEAKKALLNAAKETEDEDWWQVDRWDCWYRIEDLLGHLKLDNYTAEANEYYRKLIDINDAGVQDMEKIFTDVYNADEAYAEKMSSSVGGMNGVLLKLHSIKNQVISMEIKR